MHLKAYLIIYVTIAASINVYAKTFRIGTNETYLSPNALYLADTLNDGDTIIIEAKDYKGNEALAVWKNNNLFIQGEGQGPHLIADGEYIRGKGIWVFAGNDITVSNIEFSGAVVPDMNGAGIRLDGIGMTAIDCFFHDNENGILTSNPDAGIITIESCEFDNNGFGDGFSHNLYIGRVDKLIFKYNYSHHTKIGHNLKSRAKVNIILYNRIMDEASGNSSRLIDLSNGGFALIMGNVLMQGPMAENGNLIGYGLEGLNNSGPHEFYCINNTMVNKRGGNVIFFDLNPDADFTNVSNNLIGGNGALNLENTVIANNNLLDNVIENFNFENDVDYNYKVTENSLGIDSGTALDSIYGYTLTPQYNYLHPASFEERNIYNGRIDVGAYEYENTNDIKQEESNFISIFPNPTSGPLYIKTADKEIDWIAIFDSYGRRVSARFKNNVNHLPSGYYMILFEYENNNYTYPIFIQKD